MDEDTKFVSAIDKAKAIVNGERGGYPEDVFALIAQYWTTYLGTKIRPRDVAVMMMLLKIARIHPDIDRWNPDNAVDIIGYAYFTDLYSQCPFVLTKEKEEELCRSLATSHLKS